MKFTFLLLAQFIEYALCLKLMVLGDIHMNANLSESCSLGSCTNLGQYGEGSTNMQLEYMMGEAKNLNDLEVEIDQAYRTKQKMPIDGVNENDQDIDAIILTGSFMTPTFIYDIYMLNQTAPNFEYSWAVIREVMANTTKLIEK